MGGLAPYFHAGFGEDAVFDVRGEEAVAPGDGEVEELDVGLVVAPDLGELPVAVRVGMEVVLAAAVDRLAVLEGDEPADSLAVVGRYTCDMRHLCYSMM